MLKGFSPDDIVIVFFVWTNYGCHLNFKLETIWESAISKHYTQVLHGYRYAIAHVYLSFHKVNETRLHINAKTSDVGP